MEYDCDKRGQAHVFVYPGSEGSWAVALSLPPDLLSQDKICQMTSTLWSSDRIFCMFSCTVLPLSMARESALHLNVFEWIDVPQISRNRRKWPRDEDEPF